MYKSCVSPQLEDDDVTYRLPPLAGNRLSIYDLDEIITTVKSVQYQAAQVTTGA